MALSERETILFVEERFHPNQHAIVKTLRERGHDVHFLSLRTQPSEVYTELEPDLVEYSPLFRGLYALLGDRDEAGPFHRTADSAVHRYGFPKLRWYYGYLSARDPDLVVIKGYNAISFVTVVFARLLDLDVLFYDQDPVYGETPRSRSRGLARALQSALRLGPFVRISPVRGDGRASKRDDGAHYLPFVAEPHPEATDRSYAPDGTVRIVMIGKFTSPRKNHLQLLRVVDGLADEYDVSLTLVGQLNQPDHEYYRRIRDAISDRGLEERVDVRPNLDYEEVQQAYLEHDLYVLPSANERAAVSHLEAMAHGLPVVCSDDNGTNAYVEQGENGYLVETGDDADLRRRLEEFLADPEKLRSFGARSYELARTEYSGDRYYERLARVVDEHF